MTRLLPRIAAVLPALWIATAAAIGLGEIDVRSQLNQRFAASIPLRAVAEEELGSVKVSLASNAEFERAGLERPAYLSTLRFEIKADGAPRIEITSEQPAREPFLALLLEVSKGGNRIIREYTVFLDPPNYAAPADPGSVFYETATERKESAVPPAPTAAPRAQATPEAPTEFYETAAERDQPPVATQPAAEARTMAPTVVADGSYGPVQPNETLWSIATQLRPPAATMSQMLLALYRSNPGAFLGGIDGLLKGAVLTVPSTDEILAVPVAEARDEVMRLRGETVAAAPRAEAVRPTPAPVATPEPEPAPTPAVVEPEPVDEAPPIAEAPAEAPETAAEAASETEPAEDAGEPVMAEPEEAPAASPETAEPLGAEPVVPPPVAATPAPTQRPQAQPAPEPAREEPGLLETLLLPLVAGLVILGGIGFLVSRVLARRKAGAGGPLPSRPAGGVVARPAAVAKPAAAAAVPPAAAVGAAAGAAAAQKADRPADAGAAPKAEGGQTQQLKTQQLKTQEMPAAAAPRAQPAESTQMIDTAAASTAPVDFDLTGQFESQTVQINLDADDPVSEADFHLAYGLYDEAALLLKQAAEKEPDRNDIGIKLAETYFAAGKRAEFEDTARAIRPKLSAGEWQKVAIMGQQLAPDSPLFGDAAPSADVASADLDLDLGAGEAPAAKEPPEASAALDFSLDEFEAPKLDEPRIELAADKGEALEFDLTQFDLASPSEAPAAEKKAESKDENLLDFDLDLSGFDSGEPPAAAPQAAAPAEPEAPQPPETPELPEAPEPFEVPEPTEAEADTGGPQEIRLDDIDLGDVSIEGDVSASDEAATKLDLARAYVDMGDNEMARSLLEEVAQQGNAEQKKDAQKLIEELG